MNLRFIDWIWHIRGSLALTPGQSGDDAFNKLTPLFRESGTSYERTGDRLLFRKKDQASQDKMSVFDGGTLRIDRGTAGSVLRYHLTSRALLLCFLAPLLFLGVAQLTTAIVKFQKPPAESAQKKPDTKAMPMNPIDKALGAPAPEKPKGDENGSGRRGKMSATPAYVFAAIFALLYLIGRILEDRLVKGLFRRRLSGI